MRGEPMNRDDLLNWLREALELLQDDVYLLERGVSERCITAKLGCYLHCLLPSLIGDNHLATSPTQRFHIDCEYNRFGDDTKWFPWDRPIVEKVSKEMYYNPIPDVILHRRGAGGPNVLVVEAKIQGKANHF